LKNLLTTGSHLISTKDLYSITSLPDRLWYTSIYGVPGSLGGSTKQTIDGTYLKLRAQNELICRSSRLVDNVVFVYEKGNTFSHFYTPPPGESPRSASSVEEAAWRINKICGKKGDVFVWLFRETEQAILVLNKLSHVKYEPPYVTSREGTETWGFVLPDMELSDGTKGATALITGGFLHIVEAEAVANVAKEAGCLDINMITVPNK